MEAISQAGHCYARKNQAQQLNSFQGLEILATKIDKMNVV